MSHSTEAANSKINKFANEKGFNSDHFDNLDNDWNQMMELIRIIGEDNDWTPTKTLETMTTKYNKEGKAWDLSSIRQGVQNYLDYYWSEDYYRTQLNVLNHAICEYLGLKFERGGEDAQWKDYTIKSTMSLKFHNDWNWMMSLLETFSENGVTWAINQDSFMLDGNTYEKVEDESILTLCNRVAGRWCKRYNAEQNTDNTAEVEHSSDEEEQIEEAVDTAQEVEEELPVPADNDEDTGEDEEIEITAEEDEEIEIVEEEETEEEETEEEDGDLAVIDDDVEQFFN